MGRYWRTIRWQGSCVVVVLLIVPVAEIGWLPVRSVELSPAVPALWFVILGNVLLILYGPIVAAWIWPALRTPVLAPFAPVRAWLPVTPRERAGWILFSLITGVAEELLFRGFALHYLMHGPLRLSLLFSTLIACAVFGIGHLYQGRRGALQTLLFGVALSGLFIATGSLALPIVVHTLVNLRIAVLPHPRQRFLRAAVTAEVPV